MKMSRRLFKPAGILALIAVLAVFVSADTKTKKVDELFAKWDSTISPGVALAIIQDGEIIYARGYGMANLEHNIPITSKTVFRIGSTSKQFTAACISELIKSGSLTIETDIRKYFPEFQEGVTVGHLLYHTSGVRDYANLHLLMGKWGDKPSSDEVLDLLLAQKKLSRVNQSMFTLKKSFSVRWIWTKHSSTLMRI